MMPYPGETWEQYAVRWRESCTPYRNELRMGTTAIGGPPSNPYDISRDDPDYFWVDEVDDDNYIGRWVTGFGFINVRFPKETSRELTDEEFEWFLAHPVSL
jgi:hypothetical protein